MLFFVRSALHMCARARARVCVCVCACARRIGTDQSPPPINATVFDRDPIGVCAEFNRFARLDRSSNIPMLSVAGRRQKGQHKASFEYERMQVARGNKVRLEQTLKFMNGAKLEELLKRLSAAGLR